MVTTFSSLIYIYWIPVEHILQSNETNRVTWEGWKNQSSNMWQEIHHFYFSRKLDITLSATLYITTIFILENICLLTVYFIGPGNRLQFRSYRVWQKILEAHCVYRNYGNLYWIYLQAKHVSYCYTITCWGLYVMGLIHVILIWYGIELKKNTKHQRSFSGYNRIKCWRLRTWK